MRRKSEYDLQKDLSDFEVDIETSIEELTSALALKTQIDDTAWRLKTNG